MRAADGIKPIDVVIAERVVNRHLEIRRLAQMRVEQAARALQGRFIGIEDQIAAVDGKLRSGIPLLHRGKRFLEALRCMQLRLDVNVGVVQEREPIAAVRLRGALRRAAGPTPSRPR